jgi:hypothetical protein
MTGTTTRPGFTLTHSLSARDATRRRLLPRGAGARSDADSADVPAGRHR